MRSESPLITLFSFCWQTAIWCRGRHPGHGLRHRRLDIGSPLLRRPRTYGSPKLWATKAMGHQGYGPPRL